jgi:excisionase family DNA binding protein
MQSNSNDRLVSLGEVAELTGITKRTIYTAAKNGTLPFGLIRFGGRSFVRLSEIQAVTGGARRESMRASLAA